MGSFREDTILLVVGVLKKKKIFHRPLKKRKKEEVSYFEGVCKLTFKMIVLNTLAVLCLYSREGGIFIFCTSVEGWAEDTSCHIYLRTDKTSKTHAFSNSESCKQAPLLLW